MALKSLLFRDDPLLEAAATLNSSHIKQGSTGDHVKKIQSALIQLDNAKIKSDGIFGKDTAASVLAYKKKRNIINRSYQTTADDIVGKMTMDSLDREIAELESLPASVFAVIPPAIPTSPRPPLPFSNGFGSRFAFGSAVPANRFPTPAPVIETIIAPNGVGTISVVKGVGGVLHRSEPSKTNTTESIVKLKAPKSIGNKEEEDDVVSDPQLFTYLAGSSCGEAFIQWTRDSTPPKRSAIIRVLVLVRSAGPASTAEFSEHPGMKNKLGLVSTDLVPLKPLPGRKINIFGRGESNGFEDYSSSLPFCNDSGGLRRPWTDDPRKPSVGIADKSVMNISIRSSPIQPITISEITRIAASGCRVTIAGGNTSQAIAVRAAFLDSGLAKPIDESTDGSIIVFQMN